MYLTRSLARPGRDRLAMGEDDACIQIQAVEAAKRVRKYRDLRGFAAARGRCASASNQGNVQARIELERKCALAFSFAYNDLSAVTDFGRAAEHMRATKVVALVLVQARSKCVRRLVDRA